MAMSKYPDIEGDALRNDEIIAYKAEMLDKFVKHVVESKVLLSNAEYEMIGLGDIAEELRAKAVNSMMERVKNGR